MSTDPSKGLGWPTHTAYIVGIVCGVWCVGVAALTCFLLEPDDITRWGGYLAAGLFGWPCFPAAAVSLVDAVRRRGRAVIVYSAILMVEVMAVLVIAWAESSSHVQQI